MTELDIWQTYNMGQTAAGAQFIAVAFLAWVALRVSLSIRNTEDSNLLLKLAGTGFCLSVAYFIAINTGWYEWNKQQYCCWSGLSSGQQMWLLAPLPRALLRIWIQVLHSI